MQWPKLLCTPECDEQTMLQPKASLQQHRTAGALPSTPSPVPSLSASTAPEALAATHSAPRCKHMDGGKRGCQMCQHSHGEWCDSPPWSVNAGALLSSTPADTSSPQKSEILSTKPQQIPIYTRKSVTEQLGEGSAEVYFVTQTGTLSSLGLPMSEAGSALWQLQVRWECSNCPHPGLEQCQARLWKASFGHYQSLGLWAQKNPDKA